MLAKCEHLNPGGSIKDRIALAIVEDAEARGVLHPGMTLIEATAGNTGMGLALVATARAVCCFLCFSGISCRCRVLNLLQKRLDVAAVAEQHFVELLESASHCLEQGLALFHGTEPVGLKERADLALHLLLLTIETALPSFDSADEITDGDTQRRHDLGAPDRFVVGTLCGRADLPEVGDHRACQEGEALASQLLVFEERLGDDGGETRERVFPGADDARGIDTRQHSLVPKTLNRMRCAFPRTLDTRLDEVADLLEHVEDQLFLERGQTVLVGAEMERRQEAHIERTEIQRDAALVKT